jgi:hypothetical protein
VGIVIFVPETVTFFLDKEVAVDVDKVIIEMPPEEGAGLASPGASGPSSADDARALEELMRPVPDPAAAPQLPAGNSR